MTKVEIVRKGDRCNLTQEFETVALARDAIMRYLRLGYIEHREKSDPPKSVYIPISDVSEIRL